MGNETLKEKVTRAAATAPTSTTVSTPRIQGAVKILNPLGSMKKLFQGHNKKFNSEVLNIAQTLRDKVQLLAFGKPVIVNYESESEESNETELFDTTNLQEVLYNAMGNSFDNGVSYIIVQKYGSKITATLADNKFPNVVRKVMGIPYLAEIWSVLYTGRARYWKKTIITPETIQTEVYGGIAFEGREKVSLRKVNRELSDNKKMQLSGKKKNPYGMINVVELPYLPIRNATPSIYQEHSMKKKLGGVQTLLNEGTEALRQELFINRTKLYVDKDLVDENDEHALRELAKSGIIAALSDSGNHNGEGKAIEIIMGDPKVASYWEHITNSISLGVQITKLSELASEESTTATDAIFSKGNDVETINGISTHWSKKIAEILEKARIIQEGENVAEEEIDLSKWTVALVPNVIMNEAKITDIVIKQLGAGIINMVQAKVKLENISKTAAEAALSEEEQFHNPTLDSIASFSEEGESTDTNTAKPTTGENTQKP